MLRELDRKQQLLEVAIAEGARAVQDAEAQISSRLAALDEKLTAQIADMAIAERHETRFAIDEVRAMVLREEERRADLTSEKRAENVERAWRAVLLEQLQAADAAIKSCSSALAARAEALAAGYATHEAQLTTAAAALADETDAATSAAHAQERSVSALCSELVERVEEQLGRHQQQMDGLTRAVSNASKGAADGRAYATELAERLQNDHARQLEEVLTTTAATHAVCCGELRASERDVEAARAALCAALACDRCQPAHSCPTPSTPAPCRSPVAKAPSEAQQRALEARTPPSASGGGTAGHAPHPPSPGGVSAAALEGDLSPRPTALVAVGAGGGYGERVGGASGAGCRMGCRMEGHEEHDDNDEESDASWIARGLAMVALENAAGSLVRQCEAVGSALAAREAERPAEEERASRVEALLSELEPEVCCLREELETAKLARRSLTVELEAERAARALSEDALAKERRAHESARERNEGMRIEAVRNEEARARLAQELEEERTRSARDRDQTRARMAQMAQELEEGRVAFEGLNRSFGELRSSHAAVSTELDAVRSEAEIQEGSHREREDSLLSRAERSEVARVEAAGRAATAEATAEELRASLEASAEHAQSARRFGEALAASLEEERRCRARSEAEAADALRRAAARRVAELAVASSRRAALVEEARAARRALTECERRAEASIAEVGREVRAAEALAFEAAERRVAAEAAQAEAEASTFRTAWRSRAVNRLRSPSGGGPVDDIDAAFANVLHAASLPRKLSIERLSRGWYHLSACVGGGGGTDGGAAVALRSTHTRRVQLVLSAAGLLYVRAGTATEPPTQYLLDLLAACAAGHPDSFDPSQSHGRSSQAPSLRGSPERTSLSPHAPSSSSASFSEGWGSPPRSRNSAAAGVGGGGGRGGGGRAAGVSRSAASSVGLGCGDLPARSSSTRMSTSSGRDCQHERDTTPTKRVSINEIEHQGAASVRPVEWARIPIATVHLE
jgi:hypothetical protein